MKNLVYKTIPFDIKNVDVEEGTLWAVGSTEGFDREGDRIRMDGWDIENYLKNPVILWAHNYREPPIGKALDVVPQANGLWFKILFAKTDKAQEVFGLYADGFMRAWSVGFLPKQKERLKEQEDEEISGWDYIKQELLELSAVPVPSNPDALNILRAKGIFDGMTDELIDNLVSQMEGLVEELPPADMKPYPNEHACRLKDPAQYDTCRRGDRTAQEPESVRGKKYHVIYCKKGDGPMEQQAFRYPIATWTAEQGRAHCKYNKGSFEAATGDKTDAESALGSETDEHSAELPSAAQEPATETLPDDIVAELLKVVEGIKEVFK